MRPPPTSNELASMADHLVESIHSLLVDDLGEFSDFGSNHGSYHPSRECFMANSVDLKITSDGEETSQTSEHVGDNESSQQLTMQQLLERQRELDEAQLQLERERAELEHELRLRKDGGRAHANAREMHWRICEDKGGPSQFTCTSQNIATAAAILRGLPEPTMLEE